MRWKAAVFTFLAAIYIWTNGGSVAEAHCAQTLSPAKALSVSDAVAVGVVQKIDDQFVQSQVQIRIQSYFKGDLGDSIVIQSDRGSQNKPEDSIPFAVGKKYVLYLHKIGGAWITTSCDGTHELTQGLSADEQTALGKGKVPETSGVTLQSSSNQMFSVIILLGALYLFYRFTKRRTPKPRIEEKDGGSGGTDEN